MLTLQLAARGSISMAVVNVSVVLSLLYCSSAGKCEGRSYFGKRMQHTIRVTEKNPWNHGKVDQIGYRVTTVARCPLHATAAVNTQHIAP